MDTTDSDGWDKPLKWHPLAVVWAFAFRQAALEAHYRLMAAGIPPERQEPQADAPLVASSGR